MLYGDNSAPAPACKEAQHLAQRSCHARADGLRVAPFQNAEAAGSRARGVLILSMHVCPGIDAVYMRLQVIMRSAGPILSFSQALWA